MEIGEKVPPTWQEITLGSTCINRLTIQHEMFHSLGFDHEQNRADQDELLEIYRENVDSDLLVSRNLKAIYSKRMFFKLITKFLSTIILNKKALIRYPECWS